MTPNSVLTVWLVSVYLTNSIAPMANLVFLFAFLFVWYRRLPIEKKRAFG